MTTPSPSLCACQKNVSFPVLPGSCASSANNWTGPDWASFNTTFPPLNTTLPGPAPISRPITHPKVILLVQTIQEELLVQYDNFGTMGCFIQGDTYSCQGPWLYGNDWHNDSLSNHISTSTIDDPNYQCSSDQTYLSNESRVFYGYTADNITDGLQGIAHSASMFAAATCTFNSSCATAYSNDTAQMYYDFRNYVNSTFFDYMATTLPQNKSMAFCPKNIGGSASMLFIPTTPFNGGKEYFGVHDAMFIPGVTRSINGTIEEAKKELNSIFGIGMRKAEGVFLNMVFFTYGTSLGLNNNKRSLSDEEVYPGCRRRTWVIEGRCEGVIPPREFDLAGTVLPMRERDRLEVLAKYSGNTDLVLRDAQCDSMKSSIQNHLTNFEIGKGLFDAAASALASYTTLAAAIEAAGTITAGATVLEFVGVFAMVYLAAIAFCDAFNSCNVLPPALVDAANAVNGKANAAAGVAVAVNWIKQLAADTSKLQDILKPLTAGAGVLYLGLIGAEAYTDSILSHAMQYYQAALACCGNDCSSAVCQQAALGCLLNTGSFWVGSEGQGLNCAAK